MKSLRGFEIANASEQRVQTFLDKINAVEPSIESGWNTTIIGHEDDPDEFQGFGYTTLTPEELNQYANDLNVELVFVDEPLTPETVQSLGFCKFIEEDAD